jgi:hypothetical protein
VNRFVTEWLSFHTLGFQLRCAGTAQVQLAMSHFTAFSACRTATTEWYVGLFEICFDDATATPWPRCSAVTSAAVT